MTITDYSNITTEAEMRTQTGNIENEIINKGF